MGRWLRRFEVRDHHPYSREIGDRRATMAALGAALTTLAAMPEPVSAPAPPRETIAIDGHEVHAWWELDRNEPVG